ncbi:MAG: T9SS type A sorting domain-containing protein [Flavobacterium sp.]|nr:T9SS type A sorting domain-containing protein [Flavobacterium sp.]
MKNLYLNLLLLISCLTLAQSKKQLEQLIQAEKKTASGLMQLVNNPNTNNYDITYHKLEFSVDPAVYFISGKITTIYTALSNMNTITFDMANELTVSSVKKGTTNLSFSESGNNELIINLPYTQTAGTSATIEVTYSGAPPVNGFQAFSRNNHGTADIIYTLSEPFGARDWWPCKQDLNDKINTIDVFITAPSQFTSVSNGVEPEAPVIVGNNKTTHFHHGYPIPAYLICMSVTNYQVYYQVGGTPPNTYPIVNYLYPQTASTEIPLLAQTPLIMNLYESLYEIYPFHNEKYGHAQFGWGGGMEHTTVSFMVGFDRQLIAHELAHQWFGDKVTCGTWQDIWLNESFATYVALQVVENFDGLPIFISNKNNYISYITSEPNGSVYLSPAEAQDVNRVFDGRLSYIKGAMVLEMLRFKMGDAAYFPALKEYLADSNLAYKYAVTTDLQSHLEYQFGTQGSLQEFFNDWIYGQGYPSYDISIQKVGTTQTKFIIGQTQSDPSVSFFEMPLPITVFGSGGESQNIVLQNTTNNQIFIENIPFEVTSATFDPDKHIISNENNLTILPPNLTNESFDISQQVNIYPNPTNDFIQIELPNSVYLEKISVYNSLGQMILTNNENKITVNQLSNGIYFMDLKTSDGLVHKKFIKK